MHGPASYADVSAFPNSIRESLISLVDSDMRIRFLPNLLPFLTWEIQSSITIMITIFSIDSVPNSIQSADSIGMTSMS